MVEAIREEQGELQGSLSLPDLIGRLDLNGIKDKEAREYWMGRAKGFAEWVGRSSLTFENQLLTREVIDMIRVTEKEDNESFFLITPLIMCPVI